MPIQVHDELAGDEGDGVDGDGGEEGIADNVILGQVFFCCCLLFFFFVGIEGDCSKRLLPQIDLNQPESVVSIIQHKADNIMINQVHDRKLCVTNSSTLDRIERGKGDESRLGREGSFQGRRQIQGR